MSQALLITTKFSPNGPMINRIALAWTSDSGGAVSLPFDLLGEIRKVQFVPGTGGSVPTDAYDVTLVDQAGIDLLKGLGSNLSATLASEGCPVITATNGTDTALTRQVSADSVTLTVNNAGDTKSGTLVIYLG